MNYSFTINKYIDPRTGEEKKNPLINIENASNYGWFFIDEIQNLSTNLSYLNEVVQKMNSLVSGEIYFYDGFGFENYLIECDTEKAKVINVLENDIVEAIIPLKELYLLIRDWYLFIIDFKKKNEAT